MVARTDRSGPGCTGISRQPNRGHGSDPLDHRDSLSETVCVVDIGPNRKIWCPMRLEISLRDDSITVDLGLAKLASTSGNVDQLAAIIASAVLVSAVGIGAQPPEPIRVRVIWNRLDKIYEAPGFDSE